MSTFAVVRKTDQVEVSRYEALLADHATFSAEDYDHIELSYAAIETKRITRLAFFNRFTDTEAITIDLASQGATVPAASMRRYMQKVNAAEHVDLAREETRIGVQSLEQAGVLSAGRAAIILDSYAKVHEIFDREFLELPAYSIEPPYITPAGMATVYFANDNFVTIIDGEGSVPPSFVESWRVSAFSADLISKGAELSRSDGVLYLKYSLQV